MMKINFFKWKCAAAVGMLLCMTDVAISQTKSPPYEGVAGWQETQDKRMEWFKEARFGLFIHWGLYSAAGGSFEGKQYPQHYAEWIQTWGKIPSKQYAEVLKPKFTLGSFDPKSWARLAKKTGMKYMVLTSRHHEGFSLFNSQQPYALKNDVTGTANLSPKGRDLYREIMDAFRQEGIKVGAYYSLLDWQHPDSYEAFQLNPNVNKHQPDHERYKAYLYGQIKELAQNYGRLDMLWPDFSSKQHEGEAWGTKHILTDLIKWQPNIIINNRFWNGLENKNGDIGTPEKYIPPTGLPGMYWEVSHTMNESYGYSAHDQNWKSFPKIMQLFVETVSKGGNFLLNVGPDGDGAIPEPAVRIMEQIGEWMKVNGESIYGTTASPFQALDWGYCTQKNGKLYLHVFDRPADGKINLPIKNKVTAVYALASPNMKLKSTLENGKPAIPVDIFDSKKGPKVIVVEIQGKPIVEESLTQTQADGRIVMNANNAKLQEGKGLKIIGAHTHDPNRPNAIGQWKDLADKVFWDIKIQKPGKYRVLVNYLANSNQHGKIVLSMLGQQLPWTFVTEKEAKFKEVVMGTIEVSQQVIGEPSTKVILQATAIEGDTLPEIASITLVPIQE
ncbi:alpha-L-fucosidase [Sphingobacterium sp. UGAL515B_05]|uniref:alpha-L-fucosidase n=1 Tax=Sphingobacterium sp. UGAL515B_05 TaxID=2986767 RepID=UPI0029545E67|nr:alpha-L-fucosidase [Sphingobacterium sp. UGAL515B_05]WON94945.1 alpha-L-fucosidase [Sphingobacterium sp. UGAL515B_05]